MPFEPEGEGHLFYEYNVVSDQSEVLFPKDEAPLDLTIANNDWHISPDGSKISFVANNGFDPDGIWLIDLGEVRP